MPRPTTGGAYLTLGLVIIGGIFFAVFALFPSYTGLNDARAVRDATRAELQIKQEFLNSLDARIAELATVADSEKLLAVVLPDTQDYEAILIVLSSIARAHGVEIKTISEPSVVKKKVTQAAQVTDMQATEGFEEGGVGGEGIGSGAGADVDTLAVSVTVRGGYGAIRSFLRSLETSPRFFDVQTVKIDAGANDSEEAGIFLMSMTLWAYMQK